MELKEARKAARYSQQQVADELGMSRPTYARIEENPEMATIDDAKKLSNLFGVDVSEIFFETNYS